MSLASKRKENLNFPEISQTILQKPGFPSSFPLSPIPTTPASTGGIQDILVLWQGKSFSEYQCV